MSLAPIWYALKVSRELFKDDKPLSGKLLEMQDRIEEGIQSAVQVLGEEEEDVSEAGKKCRGEKMWEALRAV